MILQYLEISAVPAAETPPDAVILQYLEIVADPAAEAPPDAVSLYVFPLAAGVYVISTWAA